jgi:GAF domain-containing protein
LLKDHKFRTLIIIPLFIHNKFIGSLSVYAIDPEKFRFIETDFLESFGRQCAMALFVKMEAEKVA